ncbi:hypothetical protein C8J56DRAFT_1159990 [Mycena floridula]|nr:hypothetical protein C8J56DRAFT_1159990 [Mycena floridula]
MDIGVGCAHCNCRFINPNVLSVPCALPSQLTTSNNPLLPAEEIFVRDFLGNNFGPKRAMVVRAISNVERLLNAWKQNLANIDASLVQGKAMVSPMRRFPAETLQEIITQDELKKKMQSMEWLSDQGYLSLVG